MQQVQGIAVLLHMQPRHLLQLQALAAQPGAAARARTASLLLPSAPLLLLTWQVQACPERAECLHRAVQRARQGLRHQLLHLSHHQAPSGIQFSAGLQRLQHSNSAESAGTQFKSQCGLTCSVFSGSMTNEGTPCRRGWCCSSACVQQRCWRICTSCSCCPANRFRWPAHKQSCRTYGKPTLLTLETQVQCSAIN